VLRDSLGDRMKTQYEHRTRFLLPRRTYTLIRLDGKAFHTFTRRLPRPYSLEFMVALDAATVALCEQVDGVVLAYVQSDEVSLLLTDFGTIQTQAWFGGNLQKLVSITASALTAHFNRFWQESPERALTPGVAMFDSRVFTISDPVEVANYFVWRQQDATRNALSMAAQAHFPHRELMGAGRERLHDLLMSVGVNFNDLPADFKRGRLFRSMTYTVPNSFDVEGADVIRHRWGKDSCLPVFTRDPQFLASLIPDLPRLVDVSEPEC
jgi:tRNA(His) guanylyltransferase